jgi:hypothetical protein
MLALLPRIQPLPGLESGYGDFLLSSLVPDIGLNPLFLTPEQINDQQALRMSLRCPFQFSYRRILLSSLEAGVMTGHLLY